MSNAIERKMRRASPELVAVLSVGVTILLAVLGQAAWLDGKIERVDARLSAKIEGVDARLSAKIEGVDVRLSAQIESLHAGQAAIRERLAALEARVGVAVTPTLGTEESADSAL